MSDLARAWKLVLREVKKDQGPFWWKEVSRHVDWVERHEKVDAETAGAMRKALPDDLDRRGQQKRIAWIQEQIRLAKRADPLGGYRFEERP